MTRAVVELGIDPETTFDSRRAVNLIGAAKLMRGVGGKHVHKDVVRKWAATGCKVGGQLLFLPSVKMGRERLTMPEWVEAFESARVRLGLRAVPVPRPAARSNRSAAAAQRRAERELAALGMKVGGE
jgi:hypothetical protein